MRYYYGFNYGKWLEPRPGEDYWCIFTIAILVLVFFLHIQPKNRWKRQEQGKRLLRLPQSRWDKLVTVAAVLQLVIVIAIMLWYRFALGNDYTFMTWFLLDVSLALMLYGFQWSHYSHCTYLCENGVAQGHYGWYEWPLFTAWERLDEHHVRLHCEIGSGVSKIDLQHTDKQRSQLEEIFTLHIITHEDESAEDAMLWSEVTAEE